MIDLTPLDVRKKRGDFGKGLRGYDPQEVDAFLELVAERMEVLVKENLAFRGKIKELGEKVLVQAPTCPARPRIATSRRRRSCRRAPRGSPRA